MAERIDLAMKADFTDNAGHFIKLLMLCGESIRLTNALYGLGQR